MFTFSHSLLILATHHQKVQNVDLQYQRVPLLFVRSQIMFTFVLVAAHWPICLTNDTNKIMKSSKSQTVKAKISEELSVLKWTQMEDRETLPESLKYRDQGHMYYPHRSILPIIRKINQSVCKVPMLILSNHKEAYLLIEVCHLQSVCI